MRAIGVGILIYLLAFLALALGWVMNVVTLFYHVNDPVTGMTVMRAVGIFIVPMGGVLGYF